MGQSRRKASASASEGRESMLMTLPSRSIQITAKNVSSRSSFTTILWTCVSRPISRFLIRSCVMGRGVVTFSISRAMALASYTPTQMGSTVSLPTSFNTTMGMLVTGSIIKPRIFISTSMSLRSKPLWVNTHRSASMLPNQSARRVVGLADSVHTNLLLCSKPLQADARPLPNYAPNQSTQLVLILNHHFTQQAVGKTSCNQHVNITAHGWNLTFRGGKVQGNVLRGTSNVLPPGFIGAFNHYFIDGSYSLLIIGSLQLSLTLL